MVGLGQSLHAGELGFQSRFTWGLNCQVVLGFAGEGLLQDALLLGVEMPQERLEGRCWKIATAGK
jgi:hypothetical protein